MAGIEEDDRIGNRMHTSGSGIREKKKGEKEKENKTKL